MTKVSYMAAGGNNNQSTDEAKSFLNSTLNASNYNTNALDSRNG